MGFYLNKYRIIFNTTKIKMSNKNVLCKLSIPLYCCTCLNKDGTFIVAGGGGAAKTGVRNCVKVLQVTRDARKQIVADELTEFDTDKHAVMNMSCATMNQDDVMFKLAVAYDKHCSIYCGRKNVGSSANNTSDGSELRKRKNTKDGQQQASAPTSSTAVSMVLDDEINIVPSQDTKVSVTSVCISKDSTLIAAGTSDGTLILSKISPSKEEVFRVKGHKDDITDVHISPDSKHIITVSRDTRSYLWNAVNGERLSELHTAWELAQNCQGYRFRNCRFSVVSDKADVIDLYPSHIPVRQDPKVKKQCSLTRWRENKSKKLVPYIMQSTGTETISSMAVSANGVYVGVGFMEGSIAVYVAFNLLEAKRVRGAHTIFVTSLSFLDDNVRNTIGDCETSLVSVSADCACRLTKL